MNKNMNSPGNAIMYMKWNFYEIKLKVKVKKAFYIILGDFLCLKKTLLSSSSSSEKQNDNHSIWLFYFHLLSLIHWKF